MPKTKPNQKATISKWFEIIGTDTNLLILVDHKDKVIFNARFPILNDPKVIKYGNKINATTTTIAKYFANPFN